MRRTVNGRVVDACKGCEYYRVDMEIGESYCLHNDEYINVDGVADHCKFPAYEGFHEYKEKTQPTADNEPDLEYTFQQLNLAAESHEDRVNHPSHYTQGTIEVIDAMEGVLSKEAFIGYLQGNIMKYILRFQNKNGAEDLEKAKWYLSKLSDTYKK